MCVCVCQVWLIDVSQSVEPTHPHGLEFLFRDCRNVSTVTGTNHGEGPSLCPALNGVSQP